MKKITALLLTLIALAFCITGCIREDLKIKLDKDGGGSVAVTMGLKKELVEQMVAGSDPFNGRETFETEFDGEKYIAYTDTTEYKSFEEMEKALSELVYNTKDFERPTDVNDEPDAQENVSDADNEKTISDDSGDESGNLIFKTIKIEKDASKYIFEAVLNPLSGKLNGYDLAEVFKVSISVEMPSKISSYKNGTVEGKNIRFDLSNMTEETELYAECQTVSYVSVIFCGVLAIGCLAAFIILKRR